ncbi:hypothetical protein MNBD_NITROSPIRAE01-752 [hydrothermal vent metagenome]|uniref:Sulfatase-modifying factor enzyme-like domain-containing protein n=1 Tax=hydrothermal vent metagenome TaxID=652676 RepID=A0A3B1D3F6_9ZZZZ
MAWVPPGSFMMGTDRVDTKNESLQLGFPQSWYEDEQPSHHIVLQGFYIDRHEVTQGDYLKFIRRTGHSPPPHWRNGEYKVGSKDLPITFVDWHDANDYCRWLKKRLPSEVQWEKAARGTDGRLYPWGNLFDVEKAHLSPASDLVLERSPVGSYPLGVSPYGVSDMVGNVWEWTDSWYLAYPGSPLKKPEFGMKHRVVRGLSYNTLGHYPNGAYARVLEVYARAGARSYDPPAARLEDLGFRCVKQPDSEP